MFEQRFHVDWLTRSDDFVQASATRRAEAFAEALFADGFVVGLGHFSREARED